jgi:deazaflavin-dependent oxidoreductase (nitroreductase family)
MIEGRPGVADRYLRVMEPAVLEVLRQVFKRMNRGMVVLWRLGLGWFAGVWPAGFGRLLVIEHTGRKSGTRYRTPVNYTVADDGLYCIAAFGDRTDWYRNLMAQPNAAVWLPDGRWEADATDASGSPRRLEMMRGVLLDSGFAAHIFGLHPRLLDDDTLDRATETYRLVHFRPIRRRPSPDGPGDLQWVWLPVAGLVVALAIRRVKRRQR